MKDVSSEFANIRINGNIHGISDKEFIRIIFNHFLGRDFYFVDPLSNEQINALAVEEILSRYPNDKSNLFSKIKNFFHISETIDEKKKDLYSAILKSEGFLRVIYGDKSLVDKICKNNECIDIRYNDEVAIAAPLIKRSYQKSSKLNLKCKSRLTDITWIESVYIRDSRILVDSNIIKIFIEAVDSIRWKMES